MRCILCGNRQTLVNITLMPIFVDSTGEWKKEQTNILRWNQVKWNWTKPTELSFAHCNGAFKWNTHEYMANHWVSRWGYFQMFQHETASNYWIYNNFAAVRHGIVKNRVTKKDRLQSKYVYINRNNIAFRLWWLIHVSQFLNTLSQEQSNDPRVSTCLATAHQELDVSYFTQSERSYTQEQRTN